MSEIIEPFTRYDQSLMWRLHRAYYQQRGVAVWTEKEIPSIATTNLGHARLHARLLMAIAARHERERYVVVEVGGGSGEFAASFLWALRELAPELLARTTYVLTDFAPETLAAAVALADVAPWVAAGHLVTRVLDITRPDVTTWPDAPALVIANYVCCALPMRPLLKDENRWSEPWVETAAALDGQPRDEYIATLLEDAARDGIQKALDLRYEWRPIDLAVALGSDDARVIGLATAGFEHARVLFPSSYFAFLRALAPVLCPGGAFVTSDYGWVTRERLGDTGPRADLVERFHNSLGQEVQFALFDALAETLGWAVERTDDALDEVHTAVLGPTGLPPGVRSALDARLWGRTEAGQLLDFREAARALARAGDAERALRFWLRCAEIDPRWVEVHEKVAELAADIGQLELAERHLVAGLALAPDAAPWEHALGRVAFMRGDHETARHAWMQAWIREPRPDTAAELARLALEHGDVGGAFRWAERALAMEPEHAHAQATMTEIHERTWNEAIDRYRDEGSLAVIDDADL